VIDANGARFDAWLDQFFAHYFARRPVNATFIGVHDHDHLLPDCSESGMRQTADEMRELRARLHSIPEEGLTEAQRHDRQIADGFLDIQLWEDTVPHFHRGNPAYYTGEGAFSIISLFQRDSEPQTDRVSAAFSRMMLLPQFLAQGRANISEAPVAWTDVAIKEAKAAIAYFERGIPLLIEDRGINEPKLLEAAKIARDAFTEHLAWLETTLINAPSDAYAAGREAFDLYLARGHALPPARDAAWVREYAEIQMRLAQQKLEQTGNELDPGTPWREQLARLADLHPSLEAYYPAFSEVWEAAKASAIEHDLVTWPDYPIDYVPVPRSDREAQQGLYYLGYRSPAPFGRAETHRYLVTPIESDMPVEEQERRLRANSYSTIKLNHVVHHGGLGHHVQNYNAFRAESRIGRMAGVDTACRIAMFSAGTMVEGWACYATDLMNEAGFLTPLESLAECHQRARMAARALVDVAIHIGEMTLEEAADFYTRETNMPEAAAKGEAVKNSMFPGAAMMYLIGIDAIHDLRRTLQERDGAAFSLRTFHDRFLNYGSLPVALIGNSMLAENKG